MYSINTSKVTEDETEGERNGKEEASIDDGNPSASKRMVIEGMQIVVGRKQKAMLCETESMNKDRDDNEDDGEGGQKEEEEAGESDYAEEEDSGKEEDLDGEDESEEEEEMEYNKKWKKINKTMNTNMALASAKFNSSLEDEEGERSAKEEESYNKKDMSIHTGDHNLSIGDYSPDANEVSSGIFDAEHSKKV